MKKFINIFQCGILAISLTSCDSKKENQDKQDTPENESNVAAEPAKTIERDWTAARYSKLPAPATVKDGFLRLMDLGDWENEIFLTIQDEKSLDAAEAEVDVLLGELNQLCSVMMKFDRLSSAEKETLMAEMGKVMEVKQKERDAKPRGTKNLTDMDLNAVSQRAWKLYHGYRKKHKEAVKPVESHLGL